MKPRSKEDHLRAYYHALFEAWGRQHWWPARTRFEVIVGAYLTQNTAWTNVEHALRSLRASGLLTLDGIRRVPLPQLEASIRPAGYFRQKARRLKTFVTYLDQQYGGSLNRMFAQPTEKLRQELLALNGIGPETADSILLYAGNHAVFVVDAYTRRILDRMAYSPTDPLTRKSEFSSNAPWPMWRRRPRPRNLLQNKWYPILGICRTPRIPRRP